MRLSAPGADTSTVGGEGDSFALLSSWIDFMRARDLSDKTIHDYTQGVWRLASYHEFRVPLLELDEQHIATFLASIGDRSAAKHQYAKGIRSFYAWATRRGYFLSNPAADMVPRRPPKPRKERFERSEITRLLIAAANRDERRAWAILACLSLGTRRSEFVHLERRDVLWGAMKVHIRPAIAKNRKERFIDISPWAAAALHELERLAPGERLLAIQPNTFNGWVHQAAIDCGFPAGRKQRAHTLRATFASWLMDDGVPLHVVRDLMGHESATTTSDYVAIAEGSGALAVAGTFG